MGMLDQASTLGVHDELVKCSLHDIPVIESTASATVPSGVFMHGHVGDEALAELRLASLLRCPAAQRGNRVSA